MDDLVYVFFNDYLTFQEKCETGSPMQINWLLKKAGLNRAVLEVDCENCEELGVLSPVEGAIAGDNRGAFRFFLELGLTRDTLCCADLDTFLECVLKYEPPRIMKLLDGAMPGWRNPYSNVSPWWTHKYTSQENSSLQPKLEKQIILGELSEVL